MTYAEWEKEYPLYTVIMKERYFYTAKGISADVLNDVLGYKFYIDKHGRVCAGGPNPDKIERALDYNHINYIIIENDVVLSSKSYDDSDFPYNYRDPEEMPSIYQAIMEKQAATQGYVKISTPKSSQVSTSLNYGGIEKLNRHQSYNRSAYVENTVRINSIVTLLDITTGEIFSVKIIIPNKTVRYTGAGGAYYGAATEEISDSRAGQLDGNIEMITEESPIAQTIMGKTKDERVHVKVGKTDNVYQIKVINNSLCSL